ncbi:hypothetical protein LCM17_18570 [Cereibacter sphaeroides]|nr:hypothetical protein [Cereibacter sphaeroides]
MTRVLDELLADIPPQTGNGGKRLKPKNKAYEEPLTAIDKTTRNVRQLLNEEAEERAEKTARLRAARELRDAASTD